MYGISVASIDILVLYKSCCCCCCCCCFYYYYSEVFEKLINKEWNDDHKNRKKTVVQRSSINTCIATKLKYVAWLTCVIINCSLFFFVLMSIAAQRMKSEKLDLICIPTSFQVSCMFCLLLSAEAKLQTLLKDKLVVNAVSWIAITINNQ